MPRQRSRFNCVLATAPTFPYNAHTKSMTNEEDIVASKVKITVSVDATLLRELEAASRQKRKPRSRLMEEALRLWKRSRLEQALKEGYQTMAKEDRATARRHLAAGWEAME